MYIVLAIMLGLLVPYGIRVAIGPSVWDRLLGMNLIACKIIIIIIIFASVSEMTFLMDFAILYAVSGFIGTIFIALFLSERDRRKGQEDKE
ncbi:MAG: monovalent cation/H+ antiporter complex subunit F [Defluviitaleaceae bacterium]|nr:monovalent cation/H+ antiporter complex subunit F [Defluviitaleaceae bacterium]MCL2215724.1 monovalent cation/H+ antiporter complex subunit F [Defluviitaleaceae bacterium]